MNTAEAAFARSESTRRATNVITLGGVVASLALAFPAMIGLNYALAEGLTLFFFVPFVVCLAVATLIRKVRS